MSEEIRARIRELQRELEIVRSELNRLREEVVAFEREYPPLLKRGISLRGKLGPATKAIRKGLVSADAVGVRLATDWLLYIRGEYDAVWRDIRERRERYRAISRSEITLRAKEIELVEEIERLKKELRAIPEFIDLDEETGYLIMYDASKAKYFLLHPDEYGKEGEVGKWFDSISILVNFTFDTKTTPKYKDDKNAEIRKLEAEIRISVNVRGAGKKLVEAITHKLRLAFEAYVTDKFEWNWKVQRHAFADAVKDVDYSVDYQMKKKKIKEMPDVIKTILKVGAFYRVNDEEVTLVIDEEYVKAKVYGDWISSSTRGSVKTREHRETFDDFDVEEYLGRALKWAPVRHGFKGETGWEQLQRIKGEEE